MLRRVVRSLGFVVVVTACSSGGSSGGGSGAAVAKKAPPAGASPCVLAAWKVCDRAADCSSGSGAIHAILNNLGGHQDFDSYDQCTNDAQAFCTGIVNGSDPAACSSALDGAVCMTNPEKIAGVAMPKACSSYASF